MTAVSIADPPSAISPPATIAGFWRRLAAFAIDCLVLAVPAFALGMALFDWAASLGQAGRLIGFATALLYFGLLNSHFGGGQTLGKRLLGIRVVDRNGDTLSVMRSVVRFLVLGLPYFLNGLWFDLDPSSIGPAIRMLFVLLVLLVFGGGGAIVYLFAFNRRTRQSLHDLVVGSFVVRSSAVTVPVTLRYCASAPDNNRLLAGAHTDRAGCVRLDRI